MKEVEFEPRQSDSRAVSLTGKLHCLTIFAYNIIFLLITQFLVFIVGRTAWKVLQTCYFNTFKKLSKCIIISIVQMKEMIVSVELARSQYQNSNPRLPYLRSLACPLFPPSFVSLFFPSILPFLPPIFLSSFPPTILIPSSLLPSFFAL